ncbi:hypothetical protein [Bacillus sp. 179-C3.3 HS]
MDLSDIYHLIETEFKVIQRAKDIICVAPISEGNYLETTVKLSFK